MNICKLLKQKRHEKKLRQIDVASYLGFKTKNGYWNIENGKTKLIAEHLVLLCELYDVPSDFFLRHSQEMNDNKK